MSKRANPTMIGAFVLGAIVLVALALMVFGGGKFFSDKQRYVSYFGGSLQGLRIGSNVNFRGVRIGEVVDIRVRVDDSQGEVQIPVVFELSSDALRDRQGMQIFKRTTHELLKQLIDRGLRAQLQIESFVTGQLLVDLDFYPDSKPEFRSEGDDSLPEIPTVPSGIQAALERAQMFVARIQALPIDEIVANVNRITQGVDRLVNSPRVDNIVAGVERIVNQQGTEELVANVNHTLSQVSQTAAELERFSSTANTGAGEVTKTAEETLVHIRELSTELQSLVTDLRSYVSSESAARYELSALTRESRDSLRSFRELTDLLERHPEALLRGRAEENAD
jgi:paraquat-inducible protein B